MADGSMPAAAGHNAISEELSDARCGVEAALRLCTVAALALREQDCDADRDVAYTLEQDVYSALRSALDALKRAESSVRQPVEAAIAKTREPPRARKEQQPSTDPMECCNDAGCFVDQARAVTDALGDLLAEAGEKREADFAYAATSLLERAYDRLCDARRPVAA